jgi:serine/threonine protein phosphatase 1
MPEPAPAGRVLALGDIHGCDVALDVLLEKVAPGRDDTLVVLGDAVDRGPQTRNVIERLIDVGSACRLVFILGNHEEMMLEALSGALPPTDWLRYGGREMLESYGGHPDQIPDSHHAFFAAAVPYFETGTEIFVHANLEPGIPLEEQTPRWLRWERLTGRERPHPSGRRVICGHTAIPNGLPVVFEGWVCIDTLAYRGQYLTCLDVGSNVIYQAQQSGTLRYGVTLNDL